MSDISIPNGSPFDAIKRVDERGEYWLARELMPYMEYGADWRNFADVLAKAKYACEGSGFAVQDHFGDVTTMVPIGSGALRGVPDVRLTRYAAYLTAQNGDSRKVSVAQAMTYFAARTHEAETKAAAAVALPQDYEEALEALLVRVRENKALTVENAKLKVKAQAFDDWINGKGCYLIGTVAKMLGLGPKRVWDFLYVEKILISSGARRREPYASKPSTTWFEVKPRDLDSTNGHAASTTYMTPYGAEQLRLLLIKRGVLPSQQLALIGGAS